MAYANLSALCKRDRIQKIIDDLGNSGKLLLYSGSYPLSPDLAPAGTLLATIPLSATAGVASQGVQSVYVSNAGTGGTNGTFNLAFTGGAGSGASGSFTVANGAVTSTTITNIGSGWASGSPPTPSFTASSGLSGVVATPVMTGVLVFNAFTAANASASGTAGFARLATSAGVAVLDCDVSVTGQYGTLQLNTLSLVSGGQIAVTSLTFNEA